MSRFAQLFLLALGQGRKQPREWAQYAWQVLAAQGSKRRKIHLALDRV